MGELDNLTTIPKAAGCCRPRLKSNGGSKVRGKHAGTLVLTLEIEGRMLNYSVQQAMLIFSQSTNAVILESIIWWILGVTKVRKWPWQISLHVILDAPSLTSKIISRNWPEEAKGQSTVVRYKASWFGHSTDYKLVNPGFLEKFLNQSRDQKRILSGLRLCLTPAIWSGVFLVSFHTPIRSKYSENLRELSTCCLVNLGREDALEERYWDHLCDSTCIQKCIYRHIQRERERKS